MCNKCCFFNGVFLAFAIILGVTLGAVAAGMWWVGMIPHVRDLIPFAEAEVLAILVITPLLAAILQRNVLLDTTLTRPCRYGGFVSTIATAGIICLGFQKFYFGMTLSFVFKVIFAFVGAISYLVLIFAFLFFIYAFATR